LTFSETGNATVGSASGTTTPGSNTIDGIVLVSGSTAATGYNFAVPPSGA